MWGKSVEGKHGVNTVCTCMQMEKLLKLPRMGEGGKGE
jgi:hypothetical protein